MWGYAPHTPTREFLPGPGTQLCLDLRNQRVSVWSGRGTDVGLCAPRPHQGVPPWTRYTRGLGLKKSAGFCVRQQERMCYSIPRQRLSVRSGPGQPVDRGFSDDRRRESELSRMRFIPKTASCRGEQGRNPRNLTLHAETLCITLPTIIAEWGCRGIIPLPAGGPRLALWGQRAPKDSPCRRRLPFSCLEVNNSPCPRPGSTAHRIPAQAKGTQHCLRPSCFAL